MGKKFEDTKTFNGDGPTLFAKSKQALIDNRFTIKHEDPTSGTILAKGGFNMFSYGEDITVQIHDKGNVHIKSQCIMPTQFIDWGRNKKNVRRVFERLAQI